MSLDEREPKSVFVLVRVFGGVGALWTSAAFSKPVFVHPVAVVCYKPEDSGHSRPSDVRGRFLPAVDVR